MRGPRLQGRDRPGHPVPGARFAHEDHPGGSGACGSAREGDERQQVVHPPGVDRRVVAMEIAGIEPPAVGLLVGRARIADPRILPQRNAVGRGLTLAEQVSRDHDGVAADLRADRRRELVRLCEQGLLALGIYNGEVDGLYGPKTRDAIMRFERAAGLEQTGLVTASLAERLARGAKAPGSAKVADGGKPAAAPKTIEKVIADTSDIPAEQPDAAARQANSEAPSESAAAAENGTSAESAGDDVRIAALVARIQIGLQNFGELEVPLDGQLGASTIEAIRRFQERYGINADGQPSEMLVDKLEQIGALRKS